MKTLKNENGIAMVTALMLTLITLGVIMALMYYVGQGLKVSAAHKRYKTALDASHGGAEFFTKELIPKLIGSVNTPAELEAAFSDINLTFPDQACLAEKLSKPTAQWGAVCGPDTRTVDPKTAPDSTFILKGLPTKPGFKVNTKVVDASVGNSDGSRIDYLDSGVSVAGSNSGVSPQHIPSVYRLEVEGERETNPAEKASLTVLYAY